MRRTGVLTLLCLLLLAACAPSAPETTATPTETPAPTETPTATLSPTRSAPTLPPEPTETPTLTPSITNTHVTATFIPTNTKIPTSTLTFTPSLTNTPTFTFTPTFTPTLTYTPSLTPTLSFTPLPDSAVVVPRTAAADLPFGAHIGYVVAGQRVGFLDLSHGRAESWLWDFGDGTTSTWRSPNHKYDAVGRYVVTLTIRGQEGVSSTAIRAVETVLLTCRLRPLGRVRVRSQASDSAGVAYLMDPVQQANTSRAIRDEAGVIWYYIEFAVNGWVRANQMSVVSGTCPVP